MPILSLICSQILKELLPTGCRRLFLVQSMIISLASLKQSKFIFQEIQARGFLKRSVVNSLMSKDQWFPSLQQLPKNATYSEQVSMISITTSTLYFFYIVCATYMQYFGMSMVGIFFALSFVLLLFFFLIKMLRSSPACLRRKKITQYV